MNVYIVTHVIDTQTRYFTLQGPTFSGAWVKDFAFAYTYTSKSDAERVAGHVGGTVEARSL